MQAPVPTLAVVTYPPGALNTQARIVIDGVRGAIFVYQNGGPLGALIGSWASKAGTDPYGNAYPQGLSVSLGTIIGLIGLFYSGVPAAGNLIAAISAAGGTDGFGNAYLAGFDSQLNLGGGKFQHAQLFGASLNLGTNLGNQLSLIASSTDGQLLLQSGASTALDVVANFLLESSLESGINVPAVKFANLVQLQTTTTTPPSQSGYAGLFGHPDGDPHFVDAGDSAEYATVGRLLYTTQDYTINTFNGTQMAQLTFNLSAGASTARPYYVRGKIRLLSGAGVVQPVNVKFVGTVAVSGMQIQTNMHLEAAGTSDNYGSISGINAGPAVQIGNVANATIVTFEFEGIMIVSTAGTFIPNPYIITPADEPFTAQSGRCWMAVSPVDLHGT